MQGLRDFLGNIEDLEFVDPNKESFHCMDGRENGAFLGTPGGDAGEFILGLFVYEGMTGELN
jgi:hypothetical protein